MKALSIRQPWAHLIIHGVPLTESYEVGNGATAVRLSGKVVFKNIENRNWPTDIRERVYVHAGRRVDNDALYWLMELGIAPMTVMMLYGRITYKGGIIGEVDIIECISESNNPWFVGKYGFVLANPVAYEEPIPYKGRLGLFEVEL